MQLRVCKTKKNTREIADDQLFNCMCTSMNDENILTEK